MTGRAERRAHRPDRSRGGKFARQTVCLSAAARQDVFHRHVIEEIRRGATGNAGLRIGRHALSLTRAVCLRGF